MVDDNLRGFAAFLSATLAAFVSLTVNAAFVTFSERADFVANAANLTTIDFSGIADDAEIEWFDTPAGLTLSAVNFVGVTDTPWFVSYGLIVADNNFCCNTFRGRGDYAAALSSPISQVGWNSRIEIALPSGVTAVGMDLFSTSENDFSGLTETDVIVVELNGEQFEVPTIAANSGAIGDTSTGRKFFGFISDSPISSLSVSPTRLDAMYANLVDFAFGAAAPASVPAAVQIPTLPHSALIMLAAGLLTIGSRRPPGGTRRSLASRARVRGC